MAGRNGWRRRTALGLLTACLAAVTIAPVAHAAATGPDLLVAVQPTGVATAGASAGFRITVSNAGGTPAASTVGVSISATGAVGGSVTLAGDGWSCTTSRCTTVSDVAAGAALPPIQVTVPVMADRTTTSSSSGRVLLSASVDGGDDVTTANISASASTGVRASTRADLAFTLRGPTAAPARGATANFEAVVRNVGATAVGSRVEVVYPSSSTGQGTGWTCPAGAGRCVTDADVGPGATLPPLTLRAPTSTGATTATLSAHLETADDPITVNDGGSASTPLVAVSGPDMTLALRTGPVVRQGAVATAIASVANMGAIASAGAIEVSYPASGGSAAGPGWTCPVGAGRCVTSETVAPGATLPDLEIRSETGATNTTRSFSVSLTGGGDGVTGNNDASLTVPLTRLGDPVDLLATGVPAYNPATRRVTWTLTVANAGLVTADADTQLTVDPFLVSPAFGSGRSLEPAFDGDGWICTDRRCVHVGPLAGGASLPELTVRATLPDDVAASAVSLSATLQAAADANTANNSANTVLTLGGIGAELAALVRADDPVRAGQAMSARVSVINLGTAASRGPVQVSLGSNLSGAAVAGDEWLCGTDRVCTHPGPLAPGGALPPLQLVAPTTKRTVDQQSVSANITAADDQITNNNSASSSAGIGGIGDDLVPAVELTGAWSTGAIGQAVVTVANDSVTARTAPIAVQLSAPANTIATGDGWLCTTTLACIYSDSVAPGASTARLDVRTPLRMSQAATTMSVSASLTGQPDDYPYNDAATTSTGVATTAQPGALQAEFSRSRTGNVIVGQTETVTLAIRNGSSSDAEGPFAVRVTPSQAITVESIAGAGWNCDAALLCTRVLNLTAGQTSALTLSVRASATAASLESLQATVRRGADAPVGTLQALPLSTLSGIDLLQEVQAFDATPSGTVAAFRVRVRNGGEVAERGRVQVRLTASGRVGGEPVASGAGWSCPSGAGRCVSDADVPPGGALGDLTVLVPTDHGAPGSGVNLRSELEGVADDAYPANDTAQARSPIVARSGVDLVPTVTIAHQIKAGDTATSIVTVRNIGTAAAGGQVAVRLSVSGAVGTSPRATGTGWLCSTARCLHAGPLAPGAALPPLTVTNETIRDRGGSSSWARLTVSATVEHADDAITADDTVSVSAPVLAATGVDLAYRLAPQSTPLVLGAPGRYIGTVRNLGDETARDPIEITLSGAWSATGSGWTCPSGAARCVTNTDVPPGGELPPLSITDPSAPIHPAQRQASGSVESAQDGEANNDDASVAAPMAAVGGPDIVPVLTSRAPAAAGEPALFDVILRNAGGIETSGTTTVTLAPATATASGTDWTCAGSTCTTTTVVAPDGAFPTLTMSRPTTVGASSADAGVTVTAAGESSTANNTASALSGLLRTGSGADLRLQGAPTAPTRPGAAAQWVVTATNGGTTATTGPVTLSLDRPYLYAVGSRSFDGVAAGEGWTCTASLACTRAPLAAGEVAAPVTLTFTPPALDALGVVHLGASVSGGTEISTSNNSLDLVYGVGGVLRNLVAAVSSPAGVAADAPATQTVQVRNVGTLSVTGPIRLDVSLPNSSSVLGGAGGWTCGLPNRCTHPGPLAAGASLPDVTVTTPAPASDGARTYSTNVVVSASGEDITADNSSTSTFARGIALSDLAAEVTPGPPVNHGQTATYDVVVRNGGTRPSGNAWALTITAPAGASAAGPGWTCTSTLSCSAATAVAPGGTLAPVRVNVPARTRDALGTLSLSASISPSDDHYTPNNSASASIAVGGPRVDVTALVRPLGRWRAGSVATFEALVSNRGSAPATGAINVTLNSPYSGATATGDGWVCTTNLRCLRDGPIAPSATLPALNVSVPVPSGATPTTLSPGVSVDVDSDEITTNNSTDLITGLERQLSVRRAALFDGETQRARLPRGGSTPVSVRFAEQVSPRQATLTAILPTGLALDPAATGPGLVDPVVTPVSGGTRIVWRAVADQPDTARTFAVSAAATAPTGAAVIRLELASELTAAPEVDEAPLEIVQPALRSVGPAVISRAADQTVSVSGTDIDSSYRLVVRRGATAIVGASDVTTATAKSAVFDLRALDPGPATVALQTASGVELAALASAVTVAAPEYRDPQVTVTIAPRIRLNTEAFAYVSVANPSNTDIRDVPLVVSVPPGVELHPDGTGGRELAADVIERMASADTPPQFRITPADRDDLIAHLADAPPVEPDPATGGLRTIVTMPRIPAGGVARLRVGVVPRTQVTAPLRATVPIDRPLFARTGFVTDLVGKILKHAPRLGVASAALVADDIDCTGVWADACAAMRRQETGLDEARRFGQQHACTSYSGPTFGTVGSDCQLDATGPIKDTAKKKFPVLQWIDDIKSGFDIYDDLNDAADRIESAGDPTQFGVQAVDPNDKLSPAGSGPGRWLTGEDPVTYTVRFENIKTATAAAQQVRITDVLPPELDPASVQLVGGEVGGTPIAMATAATTGGQSAKGSAVLDSQTGRDVLLDVSIDNATRRLTAVFRGSPQLDDPLLPTAFGDFLPPNDDARRGEGSLTFTARVAAGVQTGATISNVADIIFDPHAGGPTIATPPAINRIDRSAPELTPPTHTAHAGQPLTFAASDAGSGIASITVTPIRDGLELDATTLAAGARQFAAPATPGNYAFDLRVVDGVGHATVRRSDVLAISAVPSDPGEPGDGDDPTGGGETPPTIGGANPPVTAPPGGGSVDQQPVTAPALSAPASSTRSKLGKGVKLALTNLRARSKVTVRLRVRSKTLTTVKGKAGRDGRVTITLKLTAKRRAKLKRGTKLTVTATVVDRAGATRTVTKTIKLKG
jgi:uncharacterized repeat protein (TIGR01451 family)